MSSSSSQMAALGLLVVQMVCAPPLDGIRANTPVNATPAGWGRLVPPPTTLARPLPAILMPHAPIPAREFSPARAIRGSMAQASFAQVVFLFLFLLFLFFSFLLLSFLLSFLLLPLFLFLFLSLFFSSFLLSFLSFFFLLFFFSTFF